MKKLLITTILLMMSVSCAQVTTPNVVVKKQTTQTGKASWYSTKCNGGTRTASGKKLNNDASTIAHKTLPMGTKVKVINVNNGKSEVCSVNDRGPYVPGRIVDVTIGVAERLGFKQQGITTVRLEVVQ